MLVRRHTLDCVRRVHARSIAVLGIAVPEQYRVPWRWQTWLSPTRPVASVWGHSPVMVVTAEEKASGPERVRGLSRIGAPIEVGCHRSTWPGRSRHPVNVVAAQAIDLANTSGAMAVPWAIVAVGAEDLGAVRGIGCCV